MKKILNTLIVLMLFSQTISFAQENGTCGTVFDEASKARLLDNIATAKRLGLTGSSRTTTYVAVKIHLVANSDGTSGVDRSRALDMLCHLNENYADQNIVFYLVDMYEMNNTTVNSHSNPTTAQFQMSVRKNQHNNAINIFLCNNLVSSGGTPGTLLGYYTPQYDFLVIRHNQVNGTSQTLTHEAGHFLSLPHPFVGWEGTDYNATYSASNPPPTVLNGSIVELANGSNCSTAGDFFCDTPADYNMGFGFSGCNYNGGAVDPTGALINPDETLYMSYFSDNCQSRFSDDQKAAVAADLASFSRNYVRNGTPASTAEIVGTASAIAPQGGVTTAFHDEVYLNWTPVSNATRYLLQVARSPNFSSSLIVEETFVTAPPFVVTSLNPGTTYHWRVKPITPVDMCAPFSTATSFTTSSFTTNTNNIVETTAIELQPNFASEGQLVNLNVKTTENIEATIRIVNMAGQVMQNVERVNFPAGASIHAIPTNGLTSGVYIVNLQTAKGQVNERLVITN
jgi:hypothetical protein